MGLRFVLGRGGIGKTTYMLNEIKKRVQDNETSPVVLLVPEQYSFEMEKKMSKLFLGEEKDKFFYNFYFFYRINCCGRFVKN